MNAAELRLLYRDESPRRMTASAPPISNNVTETTIAGRIVYDVELQEEPADRIGQSLSGEMVALIAGIRADFTSYGPRHPIRRALSEFDRQCGRKHQGWYDHAERRLCGQMLRDVVSGCSVRWCSEEYAISYPRAERLIASGLRFIGERYLRWEQDQFRLTGGIDSLEQNPTP